MDIATKLTELTADLHECRRAITYRGGEISATAGFKEVAEKIKTLPASSSVGTVIDEEVSSLKLVPVNSTKYCYLKSLGGMTYKSNNLLPFPYYGGKGVGYTQTVNGITYTVNEDRSITINGTSNGGGSFLIANYLNLPSDSYTISIVHVGGDWTGNQYNSPYISGTGLGSSNYPISTRPYATISTNPVWLSINVPNGAVVNNVVLKPMLNRGSTALPYEDYYEGLKDTKPTAIKSYRANGDLIKEYPIPEALQGTGKGVEGASDLIDFENAKKLIKTKTIALGDVVGYQMNILGGSVNDYITDDGITAVFSYNVNDFDSKLRTKALCSHLPIHTDWSGKTYGVALVENGNSVYIKVSIMAADAGISTSDDYSTIISKIVQWLKNKNVMLTYAIAEPTETDIDTSAFDPLIEVEGGGSIEIITDNGKAVPTTIIYQTIM